MISSELVSDPKFNTTTLAKNISQMQAGHCIEVKQSLRGLSAFQILLKSLIEVNGDMDKM